MTKNLFVALTTSAALTATVPALASNAGNPAAGQKKSTVCVACHGTDGMAKLIQSKCRLSLQTTSRF